MTTWFIVTLVLNLLVVAVYLIVMLLHSKTMKRSSVLKAIVMLICPVAAPFCFLIAYLFWILSRQSVDLEDVIFSKERVATYNVPEEHKEMNVVSMEDALVVSDRENLRNLMMNVVGNDTGDSLAVIRKGLRANDSETAHYAASVLQEKLGVYRRYVQDAFLALKNAEAKTKEDIDNRAAQSADLLEYMIPMLKRDVFGEMEKKEFVRKLDALGEFLTASDKKWLDIYTCDDVFHIALDADEDTIAEKWCGRLIETYPDSQSAYACRLHLYYKQGRREEFRETMDELKKSEVVVDAQLLEWIRIFG